LANVVLEDIKNEINMSDEQNMQINRVREAFRMETRLQKMLEGKTKDEENIQVLFAGERIAFFHNAGASFYFQRG